MKVRAGVVAEKEKKGAAMSITVRRMVGILIMFAAIIGTGFWISSGGKPYNVGIFTLHKLITIAVMVVMVIFTVRTHKSSGLSTAGLAGIIASGCLLLGTMVTGGMLSVDKVMPSIVLKLHQVLPFLTTTSAGITLFILK